MTTANKIRRKICIFNLKFSIEIHFNIIITACLFDYQNVNAKMLPSSNWLQKIVFNTTAKNGSLEHIMFREIDAWNENSHFDSQTRIRFGENGKSGFSEDERANF